MKLGKDFRFVGYQYCRRLPVVTALAVLLFTGCSKSGSEVQISSAVYGASTNFADVSYRVRDLIRLSSGFDVRPSFLQVDPMVGYNKVLVVVYEVKGRRHVYTAAEGDTVNSAILSRAATGR